MKPYFDEDGVTIYRGDCLDVIPALELDPVDAVVTDPPYGLKFMGKNWDHGVPGVRYWEAALRVLKPGGHLLAFGGTRTHHRLMCAIEDAGLEIRDVVMWVYGSGFPKSLDVSKAIDKQRNDDCRHVCEWLATKRDSSGKTNADIDDACGLSSGGASASHWTAGSKTKQPRIPPADYWPRIKLLLDLSDEMDAEVWRLNGRKGKPGDDWIRREVTGRYSSDMGGLGGQRLGQFKGDITAPATDAAKQWDGWGTALKPAWEPIILARKPLEGTVAENVLKYGVGGLNIDASRVEGEQIVYAKGCGGGKNDYNRMMGSNRVNDKAFRDKPWENTNGRWPANLIHDGSGEVLELFPENVPGITGSSAMGGVQFIKNKKNQSGSKGGVNDSGSAARFFYCAKASGGDRGNETLQALPLFDMPEEKFTNTHPTVKPIELMAYLLRLIVPPGGVVLDPFMGSGSTLVAAKAEGFRAIGVELESEYCEIAVKRMEQAVLSF